MTTIDQVAAELDRFLRGQLGRATGDAPGGVVMVFDKGGTPLDASDFGYHDSAGQQQLFSHQRAAQLADQLPVSEALSDGWYLHRTGSRLSEWYAEALQGSVCLQDGDDAKKAFEQHKADALAMLDRNKMLEVSGATDAGNSVGATGAHDVYYATDMAPANWFLPDATCWTSYHQKSDDSRAEPVPAPISSPARCPAFTMRLINGTQAPAVGAYLRRASLLPVEAAADPTPTNMAPQVNTSAIAKLQVGGSVRSVLCAARIPIAEPAALRLVPPALVDREALQAATSEQSVKSEGFQIDFDYCVVNFDRPWWDDVFLSAPPGWAIPGYRRGQVASGSLGVPDGIVTLITVGMVVIRNLIIAAAWTEDERQSLASDALSLGPFCVAGEAGTIRSFRGPACRWLRGFARFPASAGIGCRLTVLACARLVQTVARASGIVTPAYCCGAGIAILAPSF
ncbi:hypothetical protein [Paraburkholderia terrae]